MDQSSVLVAREGDSAFIQVNGRGSFQNAGHVKRFYSEVLKSGSARFVVNLKNCTYLDSTFLGTLTGLGLDLKKSGQGSLQVINASPRNQELMENLGLDRLFAIHGQGPDVKPLAAQELKGAASAVKAEISASMLEAHENLIQLDERNISKFKDVVSYLRENLSQPAE